MGFGSVCSIHSAATLAPSDVFLPVAIIKFHKYPDHKVSALLGKVAFRLMMLQQCVISQLRLRSTEEWVMCWPTSESVYY